MMFTFVESVRSAWESIIGHGFRSILTTLGIIIGVSSVITVISLVQGLRQSIADEFQGLGTNSFTVRSYTPWEELLKGRRAFLTPEDLEKIRERADGIQSITPILALEGAGEIRFGAQSTFAQVLGTTHAYQDVANNFAETGRFLSVTDNAKRRRVVVLGSKVLKDLSLSEKSLGEFINLDGEWLKIIGVMETRGEQFGFNQDNFIVLPFETVRSMNGVQNKTDVSIQVTVADINELEQVTERTRLILRRAHDLKTNDDDDFRIETSEQMAETFETIITTVTLVVTGIVGISLLVGGIGIMNVMLVSVTERTREIGICKALGARREHILMQFLIEALTLSVLGGLIGLLLGWCLGLLIASLIPNFPPVVIPWWAVALSIGFSGIIGVVFGLLPASQAADLDPIDALRYE